MDRGLACHQEGSKAVDEVKRAAFESRQAARCRHRAIRAHRLDEDANERWWHWWQKAVGHGHIAYRINVARAEASVARGRQSYGTPCTYSGCPWRR